jgi:hypothetical protein
MLNANKDELELASAPCVSRTEYAPCVRDAVYAHWRTLRVSR